MVALAVKLLSPRAKEQEGHSRAQIGRLSMSARGLYHTIFDRARYTAKDRVTC
jgi:hypothetical protein